MQPRNIEALTFLDERITRHLANRSAEVPSADEAWRIMHANFTFKGGKTYRLGGGGPAFFMASQKEAIVMADLAVAPDNVKLIRPAANETVRKKLSPLKTIIAWAAAQTPDAYPLLVYIQDKATDDGLLSLRLSYSPSAIHFCRSKDPTCFDLTRILKAKAALDLHAPNANLKDLSIYLDLDDRFLSNKRLAKFEKDFKAMPEDALKLVPSINEVEYPFMSYLFSPKEAYSW